MTSLEQLFRHEIEFARLARQSPNVEAPRASWAIGHDYEALLRNIGETTAPDLDALMQRILLAGDPRDVTRARDSLCGILGL